MVANGEGTGSGGSRGGGGSSYSAAGLVITNTQGYYQAGNNFVSINIASCILGYYLSPDGSACLLVQAASDSIGGCACRGTLETGATVDEGQVHMTSSGITGGYVNIPSTVFEGYNDITIEVWFTTVPIRRR